MPKCLHNRRKTRCYECGGNSICPHNRRKTRCHECGGGSICHHNRQKSRCHECGGGSICQHLKVRSRCHECLVDKDNRIPEVEEYTSEEYKIFCLNKGNNIIY
jgi:hypothetical protein